MLHISLAVFTKYSYGDQVGVVSWTERVARMREVRNAYTILIGRPEGKRPLSRPRHRW